MTSHNPLSIEFLDSQANAAAAVLQALDPREAAAYLEELPIRTVLPVLAVMETWPAANLLRHLPVARSAAVIRDLPYQQAAALLRMQEKNHRQTILGELPGRLARSFSQSLAYQDNTVGAWMDMGAPSFPRTLTVAECLRLLAGQQQRVGASLVLVDRRHRVCGVVGVDALLVSPGTSSLAQLADTEVEPIAADMSVQMVRNLDAWHRYSALPVRDRNAVYLGTLNRVDLNAALARDPGAETSILSGSLVGHLVQAMTATLAGLFQPEHEHGIGGSPEKQEHGDGN